tara:strand:+ start:3161 stop:3493 length:333 start_codon:yes stop_codon:yes gene_type:complete
MKNFRNIFREFLAKEGIAQIDAAKIVGVTQQSISNMIDPNNESPVRPSTITKVMAAFPKLKYYANGSIDPDIGRVAADNFDMLMKIHPYFRSKVEEHGQKMIIEYLERKK